MRWSDRDMGHLRMVLERYQAHSVHEMARVAQETLKKRSITAISHKLREIITEQEFKDTELEVNGVVYPAAVVSGYVVITLPDNTKTPAHIFVWESEYGKVPEGYHVHHRNGRRADNRLINLALMTSDDHISLHMSAGKRPPETFALFSFLQEKDLWSEYLTYRDNIINKLEGAV
jgi:hypothetical protein